MIKLQEMKIGLYRMKDGRGKLGIKTKLNNIAQLSLITLIREKLINEIFNKKIVK